MRRSVWRNKQLASWPVKVTRSILLTLARDHMPACALRQHACYRRHRDIKKAAATTKACAAAAANQTSA